MELFYFISKSFSCINWARFTYMTKFHINLLNPPGEKVLSYRILLRIHPIFDGFRQRSHLTLLQSTILQVYTPRESKAL